MAGNKTLPPPIIDALKCNLYKKNNHSVSPYRFQNSYGGIPQNLLTNLIVLTVLLLLFFFLRKSAWKVFNALAHCGCLHRRRQEEFSDAATRNDVQKQQTEENPDEPSPSQKMLGSNASARDSPKRGEESSSSRIPRRNGEDSSIVNSPESTWHWLKSMFTMTDKDILTLCGDDALQYLRFQKHIIFYLNIIVIFCIGIILPLNFQGTLQGDSTAFEHTTLVNLDPKSNYLWVHITLAFLFFPLAILVMRRFSVGVKFQEVSLEISKTIMIEKVPRLLCHQENLRSYFEEAFPFCTIKDLRFAYDVEKLTSLHRELDNATKAKDFCEKHINAGKKPFYVHPVVCNRCCSCFCCGKKEEASSYYTNEKKLLEEKYEKQKDSALKTPLGIVFITFETLNMSKEAHDGFQRGFFQFKFKTPVSCTSKNLRPYQWKVSYAPPPDDIYWENLGSEPSFLMVKKIIVNFCLFLITFFLTTPEYLVSQMDFLVTLFGKHLHLPSWILDFLPTLMLWSFTALMPLLVAWSDRFLGHWTRSGENHAIMTKTFWYLLFMVVFLPTFGFTTAQATLNFLLQSDKNDDYRWECIFLPDSGAFFVNYLMTAALVGAGLELIRFPELFWYVVQICLSKSIADTPAIQDKIKYEFRFGEQYARMMLMFCMTIMFSVSCPLITPFGWIFFITKHMVDRHNLLYAYKPSKINKRVHSTAISFVILSTVVLQFFMMIFIILRSGHIKGMTPMSKYSGFLFLLSVNVFSAQLWADTCKKFSPIEYMECTLLREINESNTKGTIYLPKILQTGNDDLDIAARADESTKTRAKCNSEAATNNSEHIVSTVDRDETCPEESSHHHASSTAINE